MCDTSTYHPYYVKSGLDETFAAIVFTAADDGKVHRGIALCSDKDQFNKKLGRKIAHNRCVKAAKLGYSAYPMNPGERLSADLFVALTDGAFTDPDHQMVYKAAFNVDPTEFEKNIIDRIAAKKQ